MRRAVKCDLPYVDAFQDRQHRWRYYFRKGRGKRTVLPGLPGSAAFVAAYNACLAAPPENPVLRSKAGTLHALRELYFASAEFSALAKTTQRETRYVIEALCRHPRQAGGTRGDNFVGALQRKHILGWRDGMKDKPGAANKMVRVLKSWLTFAVDRGFRADNPALRIKMFKLGEHRDWTDAELMQFEECWKLGTMERSAYALALYTGQRLSDVAKLKWSEIAGGIIMVRQNKTGTIMELPIHSELAAALQAINPRRGTTVITGDRGHQLNPIYLGKLMADAIGKAELPDACVFHGLRKSTARILEELGHRPRVMTGHLTQQMESKYAKRASQKTTAKAAIISWDARSRNKA